VTLGPATPAGTYGKGRFVGTDMTTDRSRRRPRPVTPIVLLAVLATLMLAGWTAHTAPGNPIPAVHVTASGQGQGGISLWLPRAPQPDRAGWNDFPAAVLAAGLLLTAGITTIVRRRRPVVAGNSAVAPSSPRAPPARVSTS
jgi:hypothetical protein